MIRRAFTLIEVLVVVAIIALVISIIMPIVGRTREEANQVICKNNLRQLMLGFLSFATDHNGCLPGNQWDGEPSVGLNPIPDHRDWLQGGNVGVIGTAPAPGWVALASQTGAAYTAAPEQGTIYQYVNSHKVYRCPSLTPKWMAGGMCSNGVFDYTAYVVFSGAQVLQLPRQARFLYPDGHTEMLPLPILCEEDPSQWMNSGANAEGGHSSSDRMAFTHFGGSHYASQDGSVYWFSEPPGSTTWNWSALSPRNAWITMDKYYFTYGMWDAQ